MIWLVPNLSRIEATCGWSDAAWLLTKATANAFGAFCWLGACSVSEVEKGRAVALIRSRFERVELVAGSDDIVGGCCCCGCRCRCCC